MFNEVARQTQLYHGISSKEMCGIAGLSPQHWSEFRRGKADITSAKLWAALITMEQLSPGAGKFFCNLLADALTGNGEAAHTVGEQLERLISCADREEMSRAMLAMGKRWSELAAISESADRISDRKSDIIPCEELIC